MRELWQLRDENARLKRVVADLARDKHILGEVVRKSSEAGKVPCDSRVDQGAVPGTFNTGKSHIAHGSDYGGTVKVDFSTSGHKVDAALDRRLSDDPVPISPTIDHGTEFTSKALEE